MADAERRGSSMSHQLLDQDPSRLTTFPMPGFLTSTNHVPDKNFGDANPAAASPIKIHQSLLCAGNQYWMPDHLCKVCYDCSVAFSIFRRRHHCRLCGQIFCHECSDFFVNGTAHGFPGMVRVCKFCFQFTNTASDKENVVQESHQGRHSFECFDGDDAARESFSSRFDELSRRQSESFGSAKPSPLVFGPPVDLNEVPTSSLSPVRSTSCDSLSFDHFLGSTHLSSESVNNLNVPNTVEDHYSFYSRIQTGRRRSSAELLGAIESGGLSAEKQKSSKDNAITAREESNWEVDVQERKNLDTQRDIALDKYMRRANEQIRHGIKHLASSILKQKCDSIALNQLIKTLEDMAFVVTGHLLFSMNCRSISGFNYANLVKVKSIATAGQSKEKELNYNFKWLAGTVCHKHLSHKQMAREVINPRILLLACGISYDRSNGSGRMSSLDTLLEQEKSYIAILVEKISALEPDLIFVEKSVSRYAQELLCERRISIVLNVKCGVLHRIARHTGAEVLKSVDHVDKVNSEKVIGTCRSFTVKTVAVVPLEELPKTKKAVQTSAIVLPTVLSRSRTDTYLYLDGCDPLNGCTVLITGPSKQKLRLLKQLTRVVLSMTYQLLLEAHVLSNLDLNTSMLVSSKVFTELFDEKRATWCTTTTLRVHDPGSSSPSYHQCVEAKHFRITVSSDDDVSFGNFLNQELANLSLKCQNVKCNHLMADHVHMFSCRSGTIIISFEELPGKYRQPFSLSMRYTSDTGATEKTSSSLSELSSTMTSEKDINLQAMTTPISVPYKPGRDDEAAVAVKDSYPTVIFWRWCRECNGVTTPFMPLEKYIYKYSFSRLLEILLSEADESLLPKSLSASCAHASMESQVLFFNIGQSVARFDFLKQVSLRLGHVELKQGNDPPLMSQLSTNMGPSVVEKEVATHLTILMKLLESLISTFTDKVREINEAVEAFERTDAGYHVRILLETMCISKMVRSGEAVFSHKLSQLDGNPARRLGTCDAIHRALYLRACKWITCILRLRKLIKTHLSREVVSLAQHSGWFTSKDIMIESTPFLSPIASPRCSDNISTTTLSTKVGESEWVEVDKSPGNEALSAIVESLRGSQGISSASTSTNADLLKVPSIPHLLVPSDDRDEKEDTRAGWKDALWNLYRVLGRTEPGSEFTIDIPEALTFGHPSLPQRSKSRVVLVNEVIPITSVAYALSTDSYEEELDGWKLHVHREAVESVALQKQQHGSAKAISTNWSRAALETSLNKPFKFAVVEMPLHFSLFTSATSTLSSTCWELVTVAYYPLQFEVLRELFYGSLQDFIFSISHVSAWNANGGKSGASFYRTLDDRFVVKHISSTELQGFLGCLPVYFKYIASTYFDNRESILSKTVGLYQATIIRKDTGQKVVHYICVMENVFYRKQLAQTYDLKGSSRNRFAKTRTTSDILQSDNRVLLDGNLLELTKGYPMGVLAEDHQFILKAVQNDIAFLSLCNIVDYSMVVGLSYRLDDAGDKEETPSEMTVGIIDYLRQFDLIKRVESVGKSVGMIAGHSSPTIIEPLLYGKRFQDAIRRYFMPVSPISSGANDDIRSY